MALATFIRSIWIMLPRNNVAPKLAIYKPYRTKHDLEHTTKTRSFGPCIFALCSGHRLKDGGWIVLLVHSLQQFAPPGKVRSQMGTTVVPSGTQHKDYLSIGYTYRQISRKYGYEIKWNQVLTYILQFLRYDLRWLRHATKTSNGHNLALSWRKLYLTPYWLKGSRCHLEVVRRKKFISTESYSFRKHHQSVNITPIRLV